MEKQEDTVDVEVLDQDGPEALEEGVKTLPTDIEPAAEVDVPEKKKDSAPAAPPQRKKKSAPTSLPKPTYVSLKALVYLSVARNSASVAAVQTRLLELGYTDAGSEKQGWFGPLTCKALVAFQEDERIEEDYCAGEETINALFAGTHVEVHDL